MNGGVAVATAIFCRQSRRLWVEVKWFDVYINCPGQWQTRTQGTASAHIKVQVQSSKLSTFGLERTSTRITSTQHHAAYVHSKQHYRSHHSARRLLLTYSSMFASGIGTPVSSGTTKPRLSFNRYGVLPIAGVSLAGALLYTSSSLSSRGVRQTGHVQHSFSHV